MSATDVPEKDGSEAPAQVLMRSMIRVEVTDGPDKLVWLPTEQKPVSMGMHDELAVHYGAAPGTFVPQASTLDYVVGAVAACLTGTLKRALAARGVKPALGDLRAEAIGEIVVVDGNVPVIRAIEVRYRLAGTHPDDQERVKRAHAVHHRACAVSRSVERAIDITTALELV
jgi:uncharacterized OsmC-like protein